MNVLFWTKNTVVYSSLQDEPIDKNITVEKLKQMEKELQDEAAKKNAAIKVIWVVEFSRRDTKLDSFNILKRKLLCFQLA